MNWLEKAWQERLHPRDGKGRFAGAGGRGGGWLSLIQKMMDDGWTVSVPDGVEPPDGIMVATDKKTETAVPIDELSPGVVAGFLRRWAKRLKEPDTYFGGWVEDGSVYLDVSKRFPHDQSDEAIRAAREADQMAVFNVSTHEVIEVTPNLTGTRLARSVAKAGKITYVPLDPTWSPEKIIAVLRSVVDGKMKSVLGKSFRRSDLVTKVAKCSICGAPLTDPESIRLGFGKRHQVELMARRRRIAARRRRHR